MSTLEQDVNGDGTTNVDCLGRTWTVPLKQRLTHKLEMRRAVNSRYLDFDVAICEVFLSAEDFAALVEIDPDEDQLSDLAKGIAKAMGVGDSGNSSTS